MCTETRYEERKEGTTEREVEQKWDEGRQEDEKGTWLVTIGKERPRRGGEAGSENQKESQKWKSRKI